MDYDVLMDMVTDFGHNLAMAGAETFRVDDSINRMRRIGFHGNVLDAVEKFNSLP